MNKNKAKKRWNFEFFLFESCGNGSQWYRFANISRWSWALQEDWNFQEVIFLRKKKITECLTKCSGNTHKHLPSMEWAWSNVMGEKGNEGKRVILVVKNIGPTRQSKQNLGGRKITNIFHSQIISFLKSQKLLLAWKFSNCCWTRKFKTLQLTTITF